MELFGKLQALGDAAKYDAACASSGAQKRSAAKSGLGSTTGAGITAEFDGHAGFITVHPSYMLRMPDAAAKREPCSAFVADLRQARNLAHSLRAA